MTGVDVVMDIQFNITGQAMQRTDSQTIVGDSKNYLFAAFTFSDDWSGLDKIAQFTKIARPYEAQPTYNVPLIHDRCLVPWEVLTDQGNVQVNVFAGDLLTVNPVAFHVQASGIRDGELPDEPTPGYFQQVLDQLATAISSHDLSPAAHDDIRTLIDGLPNHADITTGIYNHNVSPGAHNDIRESLALLPTDTDVDDEIAAHNVSSTAHDDIRTDINHVVEAGEDYPFTNMPYVGTAPVVESGSNTNGYYVKFADGTMVCWHTTQNNVSISTAMLGGYRSAGQTWTFPAEFNAIPVCIASGESLDSFSYNCNGKSTTYGSYVYTAISSQSAADRVVNLLAIGRWKA